MNFSFRAQLNSIQKNNLISKKKNEKVISKMVEYKLTE